MQKTQVRDFFIGPDEPLTLISGPCVIESEEHAMKAAEELLELTSAFPVQFIYKSSYDKGNRSSINAYRGPGQTEGLRILKKIKNTFNIPVITDVHTPQEVKAVGEVCDMVQIPAFLARQTDLLVAAGKTQKPVNVKKGQFMAPQDMKNVIEKISSTGNTNILLTDRGTSFGYHNLVSDMRGIQIMKNLGYPVCFDATHSVQLPAGLGDASGGDREFAPILAKAAITAGCNALFIESHPKPRDALCDASIVMSFEELKKLLTELEKLYPLIQSFS